MIQFSATTLVTAFMDYGNKIKVLIQRFRIVYLEEELENIVLFHNEDR